jgi:outer membrane murein-binding lipoprotein Lpp
MPDEVEVKNGRGFNVNSIIIAVATFAICYALKWLGGIIIDSNAEVQKMNTAFSSLSEKITEIKEQMKSFATKQDLEAAKKDQEARQLQFQIDFLKLQSPTTKR